MLWKKYAVLAVLIIPLWLAGTSVAMAQMSVTAEGPPPKITLPPPTTSGPIQLTATPVSPQSAPPVIVSNTATAPFEQHDSTISLPSILSRQWLLSTEVPEESLISQRYLRSADLQARSITLKEAVYLALRANPQIASAELSPIASVETVREANGTFDPNLTSQTDIIKNVTPTTSILQTLGGAAYVQKSYDWDFGINKVSALTNGTFGVTFNNNRSASNNPFASLNPSYSPTLALSLSQPLLQNFGWDFATINVRIAESGQRQAQWTYAQALDDFVQRIGNEYWNVVLAEENLDVARAALKFNQDLVRQNAISVKVGTLAPLDLQEAESAAATAEANLYTAEANLKGARIQIRQDVMLNPRGTFIPEDLEPATTPNPLETIVETDERALELAVEYLPSLAGFREAIRSALLQEKFAENQVLPQLNLGAQIGTTESAGHAVCTVFTSLPKPLLNCNSPLGNDTGIRVPFGGIYGSALNKLWNFTFYNYAAVMSFQYPLDNAVARAALAQSRILYEASRLNYRAALSQAVVSVQTALANLHADEKRAQATEEATYYARQALHDEEVRFRVGMATTHDLLQFQEEEVSAEGNQVQAETDFENAKLALRHNEGTLLEEFGIEFQIQDPHETPWYATF